MDHGIPKEHEELAIAIEDIARSIYFAEINLSAARSELRKITARLAADRADRCGDAQPRGGSSARSGEGPRQAQ